MSLSDAEKASIRTYVAEAQSPEEATLRRSECSEVYGVSLPTIRAVTAWTKIWSKRASDVIADTVPAIDAVPEPQPVPVVVPDEPVVSVEQAEPLEKREGGEHVNYDSEVKNAWRKKLSDFIDGHTDAAKRETMKVLCLPGKECLEIPMYLRLGFKPENIVGVEGGDGEARETFLRNAERLGIRTFVGDLEEFVSTTTEPFDVVSYDFLGPSCDKYESIVSATPTTDTCLLLMNFMMKRETRNAQYKMQAHSPAGMRRFLDEYQAEHGKTNKPTEIVQAFMGRYREFLDQESELDAVAEHRPGSLACLYGQNLGLRRVGHQQFPDRQHILHHPGVQDVLHVFGNSVDALYRAHGMRLQEGYVFRGIRGISSAAWHRLPLVKEEKEYKYISRVGRVPSPFHSVFMKIHTPKQEYYRMRDSLKFILDGVEYACGEEKPLEAIRTALHDKQGAAKQKGGAIRPSDTIRVLNGQGRSVASIKVKDLIKDIDTYRMLADTDIKVKIMSHGFTPDIEEING